MESGIALKKLGFSENEAKVYLALLSIGLTSAGAIIKKTKLHRMLVYEALDRLIDKHLASYVYIKNRKHFQASDPDILLDSMREQQILLQQVVPDLKALRKSSDEELEVKILYGHSGFVTNLDTLVRIVARHDKVLRILGGASGDFFYEAVGDWYKNYLAILKKYKVAKWQISPDSTSDAFKQKFARENNTKLKTLPVGLSSPTLTRITPEMVSIEIYTKEIVVIQIYNRAVAQGYIESFSLLWKQAKLYTPSLPDSSKH